MKEAFSLLRQSIIHVEQDDIDFDDDDDEPRPAGGDNNGGQEDDDMYGDDVPMTGDAMDESSAPPAVRHASAAPAPHAPSTSQATGDNMQDAAATAAPQKPKKSMKITHDKFVQLQGLIVMHLSAHEEATGKGMDKDELIDWYLESKEEEMEDVEQLEYERELITKMLRKLVKVGRFSIVSKDNVNICYRTTTSSRSRVMCKNRFRLKPAPKRRHRLEATRMSEHITWSILR